MFSVNTGRTRMSPVAYAAGLSALACNFCGEHFSKDQEFIAMSSYNATCRYCLENCEASEMLLTILPGYQKYLKISAVKDEEWYHATWRDDWMGDLEGFHQYKNKIPMVHIGSKESALDRADAAGYDRMYSMRLKPGAKISRYVVEDDNLWPVYLDEIDTTFEKGYSNVTRYINRYEVPGSISLLADYSQLEITGVIGC